MRPVWVDERHMQVGCHKCPVNFSEKVGGYGSHRAIRGIWAKKLSGSVPTIRAYGPMSGILVCFFFFKKKSLYMLVANVGYFCHPYLPQKYTPSSQSQIHNGFLQMW
ncbi:hypothetical protein HanPSC8_Chr03g0113801 [Helianthus annuus]|nr:hypothetical protein HanPSC8_Chr03g0113801 [Helianthus annuus]